MNMFVIKRDGKKEEVSFDKVLRRIKKSSEKLIVNPTIIAQKVLSGLKNGIYTQELDELATRTAISLITTHPDYGVLASRIAVSNHQKNTKSSFSAVVTDLANQIHSVSNESYSCFNDEFIASVAMHGNEYDAIIDYERDFLLDYFGFKTLERGYLLKGSDGRVRERPQHLWMRVAVALWGGDIDKVRETYHALSTKKFIHATPTLFNAGTVRQQLSSCFLQAMAGDSINSIFKTLGDCAMISKYAGGIGLHIHNIRAKGSIIRGTNGISNGIVPMLRVFNNTARYVDQCFVGDTEIITKTGNKCIIDINNTDEVLTSGASEFYDETFGRTFMGQINPTYNKVIKKVEHNYTGQLLTLSMSNGKKIQVTPEHPFLSFKKADKNILQLFKEGHIIPDYNKPCIGNYIISLESGEIQLIQINDIESHAVENITLYDLEIDGTHDYCVVGLGIAHNGGGKRNGSFAIYLEPWHADIEDFLKLKLNQGAEEERARDLFYALWIPDLFMKRVEANEDWTLFCPAEAPGLADVWGAEFEELYLCYEKEGRGKKKVSAQKLWFKVLEAQIETGTPYLLYKDAANAKSNQQNLGTIKSSNLCVAPETKILIRKNAKKTENDKLIINNVNSVDIEMCDNVEEVEIQSVVGQKVDVWNGSNWSNTTIMKTGKNQNVLNVNILIGTIDTDSGKWYINQHHIECTPYHKFILKSDNESLNIADSPRIDAKDLKKGMNLIEWCDNESKIYEAVVWDVQDNGRICDTYCFNEPKNHAGIFNGILTGNCTEIIEYSSQDETAVCNLASLSLPAFIKKEGGKREFDYNELRRVTKMITRNLNKVIDINFYPTPETLKSNMRHRPIGIGVQGLADVFAIMRYSWESEKALELNRRIFANIYYAAVEASAEMATESGIYETFAGSPASYGKLQFDLWDIDPKYADSTLDWDGLRDKARHGLKNSLLVAPMPTASTSQILGNTEAFEPTTSNIFTRRTLAGEFIIVNKYLLNDLMRLDIWNEQMKQRIIANNGSVQGIFEIPKSIQDLYKTAWEIKQKTLLDMAAERGAFICQSQSLNLFVADPTFAKLTSMHFYGWKRGLKTGQYYLRSKAPVVAQKFTVDPELQRAVEESLQKQYDTEEGCLMCSG
jgi:ribonucleotide reductase alpha subunit